MVATVSHRRRHLDSQLGLAACPLARPRLLKTSMRLRGWTIGCMSNHGVTPKPVRVFCACVCTPSFATLDWLTAIQASLWIILLDAYTEPGVRRFGQVHVVVGVGFRYSFQDSPRKGFCSSGVRLVRSNHIWRFNLFTSPLRVSHQRCATQSGQPAENGRLPAL